MNQRARTLTTWNLKMDTRGTQTDLVTDRNIADCLMELKSSAEFQELTYRLNRLSSGEITLIVTRDSAAGLLGPPLDPVVATITAGGQCYLSVLFTPVELTDLKVNGVLNMRKLRHVLWKLNGRAGYGFCPAFQESDFPQGFPAENYGFRVLKQPFTRIQSKACKVFFSLRRAASRMAKQPLGLQLCCHCDGVLNNLKKTLNLSNKAKDISKFLAFSKLQNPFPTSVSSQNRSSSQQSEQADELAKTAESTVIDVDEVSVNVREENDNHDANNVVIENDNNVANNVVIENANDCSIDGGDSFSVGDGFPDLAVATECEVRTDNAENEDEPVIVDSLSCYSAMGVKRCSVVLDRYVSGSTAVTRNIRNDAIRPARQPSEPGMFGSHSQAPSFIGQNVSALSIHNNNAETFHSSPSSARPVLSALIKPFRSDAPQERDTDRANITADPVPATEVSAHCHEKSELSTEVSPPLLVREVMLSPGTSPQPLLIDEDAEEEDVNLVAKEPDTKRARYQCTAGCQATMTSEADLKQHTCQEQHHSSSLGTPTTTTTTTPSSAQKSDPAADPSSSSPPEEEDHHLSRSTSSSSTHLKVCPEEDHHLSRSTSSSSSTHFKVCPVCKKYFESKEELERHLTERHHTRLHPCRYCGQKFALKKNLADHLERHRGSKPLTCQDCGLQFSRKREFAAHVRQHMGSLPFFCTVCSKLFSRESVYQEHMERHRAKRGVRAVLPGSERTLQGVLTKARRCLEERALLQPSVSSVTVAGGGGDDRPSSAGPLLLPLLQPSATITATVASDNRLSSASPSASSFPSSSSLLSSSSSSFPISSPSSLPLSSSSSFPNSSSSFPNSSSSATATQSALVSGTLASAPINLHLLSAVSLAHAEMDCFQPGGDKRLEPAPPREDSILVDVSDSSAAAEQLLQLSAGDPCKLDVSVSISAPSGEMEVGGGAHRATKSPSYPSLMHRLNSPLMASGSLTVPVSTGTSFSGNPQMPLPAASSRSCVSPWHVGAMDTQQPPMGTPPPHTDVTGARTQETQPPPPDIDLTLTETITQDTQPSPNRCAHTSADMTRARTLSQASESSGREQAAGSSSSSSSGGGMETVGVLIDRERALLEREEILKRREQDVNRKNLAFIHQLLMAQIARQPKPGNGNANPAAASPAQQKPSKQQVLAMMAALNNMKKGMAAAGGLFPVGVRPGQVSGSQTAGKAPPPPPYPGKAPASAETVAMSSRENKLTSINVVNGEIAMAMSRQGIPLPLHQSAANSLAAAKVSSPLNQRGIIPSTVASAAPQTMPSGSQKSVSASSNMWPPKPATGKFDGFLDVLMRLESKMPQSVKEHLPTSAPLKPVISSGLQAESAAAAAAAAAMKAAVGSKGKSRSARNREPAGEAKEEFENKLGRTGPLQKRQKTGWSGGLVKEQVKSAVTVVPPQEMKRLLSLSKPLAMRLPPPPPPLLPPAPLPASSQVPHSMRLSPPPPSQVSLLASSKAPHSVSGNLPSNKAPLSTAENILSRLNKALHHLPSSQALRATSGNPTPGKAFDSTSGNSTTSNAFDSTSTGNPVSSKALHSANLLSQPTPLPLSSAAMSPPKKQRPMPSTESPLRVNTGSGPDPGASVRLAAPAAVGPPVQLASPVSSTSGVAVRSTPEESLGVGGPRLGMSPASSSSPAVNSAVSFVSQPQAPPPAAQPTMPPLIHSSALAGSGRMQWQNGGPTATQEEDSGPIDLTKGSTSIVPKKRSSSRKDPEGTPPETIVLRHTPLLQPPGVGPLRDPQMAPRLPQDLPPSKLAAYHAQIQASLQAGSRFTPESLELLRRLLPHMGKPGVPSPRMGLQSRLQAPAHHHRPGGGVLPPPQQTGLMSPPPLGAEGMALPVSGVRGMLPSQHGGVRVRSPPQDGMLHQRRSPVVVGGGASVSSPPFPTGSVSSSVSSPASMGSPPGVRLPSSAGAVPMHSPPSAVSSSSRSHPSGAVPDSPGGLSPPTALSPSSAAAGRSPHSSIPNFLLVEGGMAIGVHKGPVHTKEDKPVVSPLGGFTWHRPSTEDSFLTPVPSPGSKDMERRAPAQEGMGRVPTQEGVCRVPNQEGVGWVPNQEGMGQASAQEAVEEEEREATEQMDSESDQRNDHNLWQQQFLHTLREKRQKQREQLEQQQLKLQQQQQQQQEFLAEQRGRRPGSRGRGGRRGKRKTSEAFLPETSLPDPQLSLLGGAGTIDPAFSLLPQSVVDNDPQHASSKKGRAPRPQRARGRGRGQARGRGRGKKGAAQSLPLETNAAVTQFSSPSEMNAAVAEFSSYSEMNPAVTEFFSSSEMNPAVTEFSSSSEMNPAVTEFSSEEVVEAEVGSLVEIKGEPLEAGVSCDACHTSLFSEKEILEHDCEGN